MMIRAMLKNDYAVMVWPPEDAAALAQAIRKLRAMLPVRLEQIERVGYQVVSTNFSRMTLGKRYSIEFENAVKSFRDGKN